MSKITTPTQKTIQAWIQLHHAQRMLLDTVEQSLKDAGLPPLAWYDVLLELQRKKRMGLRQYEIGDKILLNKHNLSRLLDRLEKNGLIDRQVCKEDGRGNIIKITDAGEKLMKQIWPVYSKSMQENFGDKLSPDEFVKLNRILNKVLGRHFINQSGNE